ncbi:anticodon-binding domain-containing protein [Chlamydoabsidia padenii]|nr:anticodon-binding domain-containing protein [Chlamydoabsidia padenii]
MAEPSSQQQQQQQQPRRKSVVKQQQTQPHGGSSTPGNGPASTLPSSIMNNKKSLEWLIGRRIKVKTTLNEEIEGLIYTYDRITNCIALDCSTGSRHSRKSLSFRILKIGHIKEIMTVTSDEASAPLQDPAVAHTSKLSSYLPVTHVHLDRLVAREANTTKEVRQQVAKLGVGVTEEVQAIFDALAKTLPCRWSNDSIIVMDEVIITPPYDVENCKANSSSAAFLPRVKKVLEGERRRLKK